jgi:ferredoxin--NADP+ reductase
VSSWHAVQTSSVGQFAARQRSDRLSSRRTRICLEHHQSSRNLLAPDPVGDATKTCYRIGMRERDAAGKAAPDALRSSLGSAERAAGSSHADLDRLLASVRRRRLLQAERTRAAGGDVATSARSLALLTDTAPARAEQPGPPPVALARPRAASVQPVAASPASASGGVADGAAAGVVLDVSDVGPGVRILRLARPPGFSFRAGQAVKVGLPGVATRRTYSIASAPHEAHLELCIELVPGGRLSSLLFRLAPGARLELAPKPKGSFVLQSGKRLHLMVATVTGIAPLRSMLRAALEEPPASAHADVFWILHGASHADELPYAAELTELAARDRRVVYLPTVSRPGASRNQGWSGRTGRVEAHILASVKALEAESGASKADVAVYACGHPDMVRNVQDALTPLGYAVSAEDFG